MLLKDVVSRATFIEEEFNDTELAYARIYDLYLTVLMAIANGQCEDASPKEFAAAIVRLEAEAAATFGDIKYGAELRERIAGKKPEWLEPPQGPPPGEPWHAPRAKPKKKAKKKPQRATRKKRN
jgi:hypothetical protein